MKHSIAALILLAAVACCVAADGTINADNAAATMELDPTSSRDLLVLGIRTHEAKKAAADQVKANSNPGTAKGDKAAAKAVTHQNRAGVAVPGVTGTSGRHLLEEETAPTRDLLILGYRTHEAKKAAAAQVKANAHPGTAKGDKEAAKALKYQARSGVQVPGVTGVSGRHLLEEESEAANRNLLILGYKTHEAKKAAKESVKAQSHASRAGLATPTATTAPGRRLQEAAARDLLILGYRTHEAKRAAADQVKANAHPGTAKGDKEAAKALSHQAKAGVAVPGVTGMSGRRMLEEESEAANRNLLILGYKTHEAKKAAKESVKAQTHASRAGIATPTAAPGRHLLEADILGYKTHEAKKAAKESVKAQTHASRAGIATPMTATTPMGRHLLEEQEAAARNLLILGYKTHEAKKAAKESVKAQTHASRAGITTPMGRHLLEADILGYKTHEAKKAAKESVKAQTHASRAGIATPMGRHLLEVDILGYKTHEAKKAAKESVKAQTHASRAGIATPMTAPGRHLLEADILGYKTHEAKKAAKESVKAQSHASRAGLATPTATTAPGRHLLEADILGYKTHEAKKAAADQVKANSNPGTAKGDKAAAKAVTHQNRAGVAVPGVTGTSGRHL